MRILVTPTSFVKDRSSEAWRLLDEFLAPQKGEVVINPHGRPLAPEELLPLLDGVDGYLAGLDFITSDVLMRAPPSLKVISRYGAGMDRVDVAAANRRGIVVTNTPGVNSQSVADLAFGLMLAVARKIPMLDRSVKMGAWPRSIGVELYRKTLGIIGLGAVGKNVAMRARGFSMRILAYDPILDPTYTSEHGIESCTLERLFEESDFLSLHVPLLDSTRNIVGRDAFARMKVGTILVNTSRGGLIDEAAAVEALQSGILGGLGLDAFEEEPPIGSPFLAFDQVVATPHVGAHTAESIEQMGTQAVSNLIRELKRRAE